MTAASDEQDLPNLLARFDALRFAERRVASARMVSVIAHLIGTPLNVIAGRAALLRGSATPEAIDENVRRIEEQVERLSQRIRRLVDYFALAEAAKEKQPLGQVMAECRAIYGAVATHRGVVLEMDAGQLEDVKVDGMLLSLSLSTLISLALRTAPKGNVVRVAVAERGPGKMLLTMTLPGVAVPPTRLDRLDPPEHGVSYDVGTLETLWICTAMTRRCGGTLELIAAEGGSGSLLQLECPQS